MGYISHTHANAANHVQYCFFICIYSFSVCVEHLNRCKTSIGVLVCRGVQSTVETAPNEAIHLCWKQSLINSVYLQFQSILYSGHGTRLSPEPHPRFFRLHVRLPQSALTMDLFYWFELLSISEFKAILRMGIVRASAI